MKIELSQLSEFNQARNVMLDLCPSIEERACVLSRLVVSADAADAIAPAAWAVSLFSNGFRLNVGQIEAVVFVDGVLRINLCGMAGQTPFVGPDFVTAGYRSVPQPLCAFVGSPKDYELVSQELEAAHLQFVRLAATTSAGMRRRGTAFWRSHCEGLMQYARSFHRTGAELPAIADTLVDASQVALRANDPSNAADFVLPDVDLSLSAIEGAPRLVFHLHRERSRKLVEAKKAAVMADRGALACEACGFDFSRVFGSWAEDFCEVHHKVSIAHCVDEQSTTTTLEDLAILCSNCHRVIHRVEPMPTVEALAQHLHRQDI